MKNCRGGGILFKGHDETRTDAALRRAESNKMGSVEALPVSSERDIGNQSAEIAVDHRDVGVIDGNSEPLESGLGQVIMMMGSHA